MSHPARVRGLKSVDRGISDMTDVVAPRAGAWIEIANYQQEPIDIKVAPRAGAWIEITIRISPLSLAGRRTPRGCVD